MDLSACVSVESGTWCLRSGKRGTRRLRRGEGGMWKVERDACGALVEDREFKGSSFGSQFPL